MKKILIVIALGLIAIISCKREPIILPAVVDNSGGNTTNTGGNNTNSSGTNTTVIITYPPILLVILVALIQYILINRSFLF